MLPKLDSRRGILNFGGTILQTLFGIATVSDMLHETLDELKSKDVDIAHSLVNQVTYVKSLDHTVRVNTDAILNLSTILENEMIQSHDNYQQIIRDIAWLNIRFIITVFYFWWLDKLSLRYYNLLSKLMKCQ